MRGKIKGAIGNGKQDAHGTYVGEQLYSIFDVPDVGSVYTDVFYNDKGELQIAISVYPRPSPSPRQGFQGFMIYKGPFPTSKEDTLPHFAKMVQDALETES